MTFMAGDCQGVKFAMGSRIYRRWDREAEDGGYLRSCSIPTYELCGWLCPKKTCTTEEDIWIFAFTRCNSDWTSRHWCTNQWEPFVAIGEWLSNVDRGSLLSLDVGQWGYSMNSSESQVENCQWMLSYRCEIFVHSSICAAARTEHSHYLGYELRPCRCLRCTPAILRLGRLACHAGGPLRRWGDFRIKDPWIPAQSTVREYPAVSAPISRALSPRTHLFSEASV